MSVGQGAGTEPQHGSGPARRAGRGPARRAGRGAPRRAGRLGRRLALVVAATVAGAVLLVAAGTFVVVAVQLERGQDVALLREATRIQRGLQDGSGELGTSDADASGGTSGADEASGGDRSDECVYVGQPACARIVDATDRVGSGHGALRITPAAVAVARGTIRSAYDTVTPATGPRVRTLALRVYDGRAVLVGIPTTTTDRTIARTGVALLATGAVGVLGAVLVGLLAARAGLRPVRRLQDSVDRVARTRDPHDRVEVVRNDELGRLASSFNRMLAELATAEEAQRRLVADASHELRTPLTTLRTNLTLLRRDGQDGRAALSPDIRERLDEAVDRELTSMQDLLRDLLDLAHGDESAETLGRGGADVPSRRSRSHERAASAASGVDLADAVHDAVATAARHRPTVTHRVDLAADVVVHGDRDRLLRLLGVLLDNAGKYGGSETSGAVVDVRTAPVPTGIELTVGDRGPGITPEDLPRVFDRFWRAPAARSRPGSGLGLAIAHQIVTALGGTIVAEQRVGGGTVLRVVLPGCVPGPADDREPTDVRESTDVR